MFDRILTLRAKELVSRFSPYLNPNGNVLDIGAGSCHITRELQALGQEVVPVDVANLSRVKGLEPEIYDGNALPYEDKQFDLAILITVLHHTPNPEEIIAEAARVAKRLVIIEDVVRGPFHKWLTGIWDSILNFEFFGHPHSNKTDQEWREVFANNKLRITDIQQKWSFIVMWQVTYYLEGTC